MRVKAILAAVLVALLAALGGISRSDTPEVVVNEAALAPALHWVEAPERGEVWQRMVEEGRVTLDPNTGDYTIKYTSPSGEPKSWVFEPANKVQAFISAEVTFDPASGVYTYRYTASSATGSIQKLHRLGVRHEGCEVFNLTSPPDDPKTDGAWRTHADFSGLPVATWTDTEYGRLGIAPGETVSGFSFQSYCGPGYVPCYAQGRVPIAGPFAEGEAPEDPRPIFVGNAAEGVTLGPVPAGGMALGPRYVPLRHALASLGWSIAWRHLEKKAIARSADDELILTPGSNSVVLNGASLQMPASTRLEDGRVLVAEEMLPRLASMMAHN